ncbi:cysteine hydrolase family protein [Thermodesulfobacteriota bacterium]
MSTQKPKLPEPEPITVDIKKTAILVLDGSQRWGNPALPCNRLIPAIPNFLDRARAVGLPIIYTVSFGNKGTPEGQVYTGLNRRPCEPVIYPDGFNKFTGGELQSYLNVYDVDTLIITGYRSNISVLNTATKATRELRYNVIIPIDGMTAITDYEQEYTLFHFTVLPAQAAALFTFTLLGMIDFKGFTS